MSSSNIFFTSGLCDVPNGGMHRLGGGINLESWQPTSCEYNIINKKKVYFYAVIDNTDVDV